MSSFAGPARGKLRVRGEPAAESEFNMVAAAEGDQVSLAMIASSLDGQQPQTKKAVERLARTAPTVAAIGTETATRLERGAAYTKASRDLQRWNDPVTANREKRAFWSPFFPFSVVVVGWVSPVGFLVFCSMFLLD